jgi:hypothetical protein
VRSFLRIDFPLGHAQPSVWRWLLATLIAVAGSVAACGVLVIVGESAFPATIGYVHFQFADYGKLTIIGVLFACCAWPFVTLVSSRARRLFLILAVLVTLVSFAPDAWILHEGQPAEAVSILIAMHVALAVITYPALVFVAPQRRSDWPDRG